MAIKRPRQNELRIPSRIRADISAAEKASKYKIGFQRVSAARFVELVWMQLGWSDLSPLPALRRHGQNERAMCLTRKNALFAGHEVGAENWALLSSVLATCKLNDVNPVAYLAETLDAIINGHWNPHPSAREWLPTICSPPSSDFVTAPSKFTLRLNRNF